MDDPFLALRDKNVRRFARVPIPEWMKPGDEKPPTVRIQSWTGLERIAFEAESSFIREHLADKDDAGALWFARAALRSMIEADGQPLFVLPTLAELRELAKESTLEKGLAIYRKFLAEDGAAINRIYNAVARLNALGVEAEYEIEKN